MQGLACQDAAKMSGAKIAAKVFARRQSLRCPGILKNPFTTRKGSAKPSRAIGWEWDIPLLQQHGLV